MNTPSTLRPGVLAALRESHEQGCPDDRIRGTGNDRFRTVSFRSRLHEFVLGAAGCAVDFGTFRSGVVFTFVLLVGRMVWTAVAIPRSKGRLT